MNDTVIQLHRGKDNFLLQAICPDNILATIPKVGKAATHSISRDHLSSSPLDSLPNSPHPSVSSLIPCNLDVFDIQEGQQLRVVHRITESNAPVYRFEVGHIEKKLDGGCEWKRAEGRSHIAGKIMEHSVR